VTHTRKVATFTSIAVTAGITALAVAPGHSSIQPVSAAGGASSTATRVADARGSGELVVDWNRELLKIEQTAGAQPATVHPTRSFALLQAAVYDAVVSVTHDGSPYAFEVVASSKARPDAAADEAAHDVLAALFPSFAQELDGLLTKELSAIPSGPSRDAGLASGARVATLMLALRAHDGSSNPPPLFVAGNQPGNYQVTPPNTGKQPVFTGWGSVAPWVLDSGAEFRPAPPPALTSTAWAQAINEVHRLGGGQGSPSARTADQTQIGLFWAPPIWNTWNEIADGQLVTRHSSLATASHVLADLDLTVADSVIAFYDAKYTYTLWRPITAIRAGTPGNPAVDAADPSWNPLTSTALDPSYPGAHATVSEAAATVLTEFFGSHVDITVQSDAAGFANVTRSFPSFQGAADEASLSRILAGQHTRIDETAGSDLGRHVANAVLAQPFGHR
jgi:PAP2 superfamily protein